MPATASTVQRRRPAWLPTRFLGAVLLPGFIAAIPVVVASVRAIRLGWTPFSDDGVIATRAFDVLTANPPLVGQWSQASPLTGYETYSPGPMLYWLLAIPAHLGSRPMIVTMGAVNTACVVGTVAVAGRRGGRWLAIGAALALAFTVRSLPVEVPYEVWNCWAAMFSFLLLVFLAWSIGCGDHALLPIFVLASSFVVQTHLTYAIPTLACGAVAAAGLVMTRPWRSPGARAVRWSLGVALLVGLACWSAPLVDQMQHRPGNLTRVYQLAIDQHPTVGIGESWKLLVSTLRVPPRWTGSALTLRERLVTGVHPSLLAAGSAGLVLASLVGMLVLARRRERHDVVVAMALSLGLCVSVLAVEADLPTGRLGFAAAFYALQWISPAGMFVWLMLGWSTVVLLVPHRVSWLSRSRVAAPAGLALAAVVAMVTSVRDASDVNRFPPGDKDFGALRAATTRVTGAVGKDKDVLVVHAGVPTSTFETALVYALRRKGVRPAVIPAHLVTQFGEQYAPRRGTYRDVVTVIEGGGPGTSGAEVLVRSPQVTVTLARADRPSPRAR